MSPTYKASVVRGIISPRVYSLKPESLIGTYNLGIPGWIGIYDGDEDKILAVVNKKLRVLRIRSDSPLVNILQGRKGWSVVPSDTLDKYEAAMRPIKESLSLEKVAQPLVKKILGTKEGTVEVDLFYDTPDMRRTLVNRVCDRLDMFDAVLGNRVYEACRRGENKVYQVTIPPKEARVSVDAWEVPF